MPRLDPDHEALFRRMVEASRSVPKRSLFYAHRAFGGDTLQHPGLPGGAISFEWEDLDFFKRYSLVLVHNTDRYSCSLSITAEGYDYYEKIQAAESQPVARVESVTKTYLEGDEFRRLFPEAYEKWRAADELLWKAESGTQLTEVGHYCREAVQEFAQALLAQHDIADPASGDKQRTVARVRTVIDSRRAALGETVFEYLDALLDYFGCLSDLIQRQEHGARQEGQQLTWEDARRVVLQTMVVMFEVDRALRIR